MAKRVDLDRVGAWASAACAVHCLLTSVALGVLGVIGLDWLGSLTSEIAFFGTAIVVGSFAVFQGYHRHRSWIPALILACGLSMVVVSHFVLGGGHAQHGIEAGHAEAPWLKALTTILSVGGGLTLVAFHITNARLGSCRCGQVGCQARPITEARITPASEIKARS